MSLIQNIKARRLEDLLNEGSRITLTDSVTGTGSPVKIFDIPSTRFLILTGYQFSSDNGSPVLVTLSIGETTPSIEVFNGYVGGGQIIDHSYALGDYIFGELDYDLFLTVASSISVAYTIEARISSSPVALGYIQQIGSKEHANPYFGLESGKDRGQSEL